MFCDKQVHLIKFLGSIIPNILYFVAFNQTRWVFNNAAQWGFFGYCINETLADVYNTTCIYIDAGDSAGYFEACRTFSVFALVGYILMFFAFDPRKGLGHGKKPACLATSIVLCIFITLIVLGTNYEDDVRISRPDDPASIGWCFIMAAVAGGLSLLVIPAHIRVDTLTNGGDKGKTTVGKKVAPVKLKPKPTPKPKPQTQPQPLPPPKPLLQQKGDGLALVETGSKEEYPPIVIDVNEKGSDGQQTELQQKKQAAELPILTLPQYDVMPEPGEGDSEAPPPDDYMTALPGETAPPKPVTVSTFKKSVNFFKNYARAAVGLKYIAK